MGTIVALVVTLPAVQPDKDFDGLNNLFQIPLALPWFLLPTPLLTGDSHVVDAWVAAGWGLLNAGLIFAWISRRDRVARS